MCRGGAARISSPWNVRAAAKTLTCKHNAATAPETELVVRFAAHTRVLILKHAGTGPGTHDDTYKPPRVTARPVNIII